MGTDECIEVEMGVCTLCFVSRLFLLLESSSWLYHLNQNFRKIHLIVSALCFPDETWLCTSVTSAAPYLWFYFCNWSILPVDMVTFYGDCFVAGFRGQRQVAGRVDFVE